LSGRPAGALDLDLRRDDYLIELEQQRLQPAVREPGQLGQASQGGQLTVQIAR